MTAQFPDTCRLRGHEYVLAGVKGTGLFAPSSLGLQPTPTCSACWRGYVCHYGLQDDRLVLAELQISLGQAGPAIHGVSPTQAPGGLFDNVYKGLDLPVPFSGGMLLGDGFIQELYVHMGFHRAWKYRTVLELVFDAGRLAEERDVSRQMAELRKKKAAQPEGPAAGQDLRAWIESTFRLDYDL